MSTIGAHDAPAWRTGWHHQSLLADDVDEHAAQLNGWHQQYDQLTAGAFVGQLDQLSTGQAQVFRERTSQALRQRCEVWPGAVWCGITALHDGSRINGRLVGEHGVMVCGQAARFELVSPAGHDILGVVIDRAALQQHAQAQGVAVAWALLDGAPWLQLPHARRQLARARLRAVLALAGSAGDAHRQAAAANGLEQALLDAVVDLLEHPAEPEAMRCNATARRHVVQQVHEWIAENPAAVPSVPQLCARLNISRRTLQYAFEAETAMSPKAYLRSIRLNGARRTLREGAGSGASVREAAAAWGFWNLSQFASDYRHQFGERPSDTLTRSPVRGLQLAGVCRK
ncbi:MAG TPA: helix-turn-helix domain-containing protein [Ideonella sp.]|uniref:helix-turn-helix domain-containing protein n=1 Tax=Ideonella sp. TaxID=1929293 RepID=UPI002E35CD19|nr:helix-turn-helix domain-containing protein [Ideonella sp.]HEX5686320.1 helix-turn-helix domain-containing protein [Ideonella sp.]